MTIRRNDTEGDEDYKGPIKHERKPCKSGHCGCYYTNGNKCCFCKVVQIEPTYKVGPPKKHFGERAEALEEEMRKRYAENAKSQVRGRWNRTKEPNGDC